MARKIALFAMLVLLTLAFTGCDQIEIWLGTGKPNLTVTSVEALSNATTGEITGVRVVIKNTGTADATDVEYAILLTDDDTVSLTNDTEMYWDVVTLAIDEEQQIDIGNADSASYMSENGISTPADGKYYIGVSVDPDNLVTEKTETDNEGVSSAGTWYIGGAPMAYVIQGTISINDALGYWDGAAYQMLQNGHAYPIYIFAVPSGIDLPTENGSVVTFPDWMIPGSAKVTVTYSGNIQSFKYTVGVPTDGEYYVAALMDADKNGSMTIQNGPGEPYALWPPTTSGPIFTTIDDDVAGADTDMYPGSDPS